MAGTVRRVGVGAVVSNIACPPERRSRDSASCEDVTRVVLDVFEPTVGTDVGADVVVRDEASVTQGTRRHRPSRPRCSLAGVAPGALAWRGTPEEKRPMSALRVWLDGLGLGQYADRFEREDVDTLVIGELSDRDL